MGDVILLSRAERSAGPRLRDPLPPDGASVSLFLGVRYERHDATAFAALSADVPDGPRGEPPATRPPDGRKRA